MKNRRIVITGIGIISSLGIGREEFWTNILNAKSGVHDIDAFDVENLQCKKGSLIKNLTPTDFYPGSTLRRVDRFSMLGMVAAKLAIMDSAQNIDQIPHERKGSILKTIWGSFRSTEDYYRTLIKHGPLQVSPMVFSSTVANSPSGHISKHNQLKGVSSTLAGGSAISYAYQLLQNDKADMILVGGIDELHETVFKSYSELGFLAHQQNGTDENSRPFDKDRNGYILGEGAVILILQELEHALKNNAKIYAELSSVSILWDKINKDDGNQVDKDIDTNMAKVMESAMKLANVQKDQIDLITAMANSTQKADLVEGLAINRTFNGKANRIPIAVLKSNIGETFGASDALNTAYTALAIKNEIIPPTINLLKNDEKLELLNINTKLKQQVIKTALSNSYEAIGGNISSIVLQKFN
jgi:3-oxoacyl-[acyl-carrier-protein] synthase II